MELEEFRDCVQKEGIPLPQTLAVVTRNMALRLDIAPERGSRRKVLLPIWPSLLRAWN